MKKDLFRTKSRGLPRAKSRGFALIYVLLIMTIIMISLSSILSSSLSDVRQKNKVQATAGAYQMAQSGLEDGIANYQLDKKNQRKYYNVAKNKYTDTIDLSSILDDQGSYYFEITGNKVTAIGYFKGSKLKMQADKGADDTKWDIYQVGF